MCKHVAAALYGTGARLDAQPQLLFALRGVDEGELLKGAGEGVTLAKSAPAAAKVLDDGDVAALFGLEMAEDAPGLPKPAPRAKTAKNMKGVSEPKRAPLKAKGTARRARG
jgi:uncharacterized Zn finger protein